MKVIQRELNYLVDGGHDFVKTSPNQRAIKSAVALGEREPQVFEPTGNPNSSEILAFAFWAE